MRPAAPLSTAVAPPQVRCSRNQAQARHRIGCLAPFERTAQVVEIDVECAERARQPLCRCIECLSTREEMREVPRAGQLDLASRLQPLPRVLTQTLQKAIAGAACARTPP